MEAHGGDGETVAEEKKGSERHLQLMSPHIECSGGVVGLAESEVSKARFLKRTIRIEGGGWELEADPKDVCHLFGMHSLEGGSAKGCATLRDKTFERMKEASD